MSSMRTVGVCALACLFVASTAAAKPLARYLPGPSGYIGESFALRKDGRAVAYVVTDGASNANLQIVKVGGAARSVPAVPIPTALWFAGADRILLVATDSAGLTAQLFDRAGAASSRVGPVEAVELGAARGRPAIVTYLEQTQGARVEHVVAAYDPMHLSLLSRVGLRADSKGEIITRAGLLEPLWWDSGHTVVAGLVPGSFDRAHDIQEPNRFVREDVFTGKVEQSQAIPDLLTLAAISAVHRRHGEAALAQLVEDHRQLELVDGLVQRPIALPRSLSIYDPTSLTYEELDAHHLALSLTVEPMNPTAHGRPVPNDTDLYLVDRATGAARLALRIPGNGGRVTWRMAGDRVAALRHDRGWSQGGSALEIYALTSP